MPNASKSYFAMPRGLNTEAPLINFPDGYTSEEQNYELTIQGSRRRRPGLSLETGGVAQAISSGYTVGDPVRMFDWENVAGRPGTNLLVMQVGYILYIFEDSNPTSTTLNLVTVDIRPYAVDAATDAQVSSWPLESAFGRGHLFLFGKYTNPFYIEFDPDTELFSVNQINITERDFQGVLDGYDNTAQPATPIDSHTYNLRNRGWVQAYIDAFQTDQSKQPSKAMIPWLGLKRALTAGNFYDLDGVRSFSPDKLIAEIFQDASAPTGHFIKSPFDAAASLDTSLGIPIESWSIAESPGPQTMTIQTSGPHGLLVADVAYVGNVIGTFMTTSGYPITPRFTVDQYVTVTNVGSAVTFDCIVEFPGAFTFEGWLEQYFSLGTVTVASVSNPSGNVIDFRPKAGAFFAGRAWYAGIDTARLGGRVYFSQVIENDAQYGKCYQVADPTDERISDLSPADGGVIVIPEAGNVVKLVPYSSSLLVFASNGVWEIGAGDLGYFAATSYSVRKITDSGAVSPGSVVLIDNLPVYWGVTDIYAIEQNPQTGFLQMRNMSQDTINTFYNEIPLDKRRDTIGVFDDLNKRVVWLHRTVSELDHAYDRALIFDARLKAFVPYAFAYTATDFVAGVFVLKEAGEVPKVKYIGMLGSGTSLHIGEPNNTTTYEDFGIAEPDCYMITGYDSLRDPGNFKQAPMITVFSKKTEEGYGPAPNYEPVRTSSTQMRARWDWSDNASASKWGRYQEVYRHRRVYIPVDPSTDGWDDGAPLVVSRSQLRGKGRVMQLEFRAGSGKDSHVQGWKTNFTRIEV